MRNKKKINWADAKAILIKKEKAELLKLIADLYSFNEENKAFINSRFSIGENPIDFYKAIITESLYPDLSKGQSIMLSKGKKAISTYFKATKDKIGKLELMMHYLETGNQFAFDFGDMYDRFYYSLESMFNQILVTLEKESENTQKEYFLRLEKVVASSKNFGWGYYETICELFTNAANNTSWDNDFYQKYSYKQLSF